MDRIHEIRALIIALVNRIEDEELLRYFYIQLNRLFNRR